MQEDEISASTCISIFKSTSVDERTSVFNEKWIELINRMERQKSAPDCCQK